MTLLSTRFIKMGLSTSLTTYDVLYVTNVRWIFDAWTESATYVHEGPWKSSIPFVTVLCSPWTKNSIKSLFFSSVSYKPGNTLLRLSKRTVWTLQIDATTTDSDAGILIPTIKTKTFCAKQATLIRAEITVQSFAAPRIKF